jgi:hypothetical protein
MRPLREPLDRSETLERELNTADQPSRACLLSAWKEQILEDIIEVLQETTDHKSISYIGCAIATVREVNSAKA